MELLNGSCKGDFCASPPAAHTNSRASKSASIRILSNRWKAP